MEEYEYLDAVPHDIGMLYLTRTPCAEHPDGYIHEFHVDGALLMSSVSPLSEREIAIQALAAHRGDGPQRILVGGLGLGYTAAVALESHRASVVRVVERMDVVIGWMKDGRLPLSKVLNGDRRLEIEQADVYSQLLGEASETWDLIIVDVDHAPDMPLDPSSLPFYTAEGQRAVAAHLAPGGVVAVWSAFDNDDFVDAMAEVYSEWWWRTVTWDSPGQDGMMRLTNTLFFGRVAD